MLESLACIWPLLWVFCQKAPDEILCLLGHHGFPVEAATGGWEFLLCLDRGQVELASFDSFKDLTFTLAIERIVTLREESVGDDTQCPNVTLFVVGCFNNLRRNIMGCTDLAREFVWSFILGVKLFWKTEVDYPYVVAFSATLVPLEHDVFEFEVSMTNAVIMHELDRV